jgi:hypothetical protein
MSNECKVFQMRAPRNSHVAIRPVPFLAYSTLSDNESVMFNKSTQMITIVSSLAGTLTFEATDGTDPDGTVAPFPIIADTLYDFDVRPGTIMRYDI